MKVEATAVKSIRQAGIGLLIWYKPFESYLPSKTKNTGMSETSSLFVKVFYWRRWRNFGCGFAPLRNSAVWTVHKARNNHYVWTGLFICNCYYNSSLKYVNYEENALPQEAQSHFIHLLLRNFLLQTLFKRSGCILGPLAPLVPHLPG